MNAYIPRHKKKQTPPTIADFQAFNSDGSLKHGIIKAFLIRETVSSYDAMDRKISLSDYKNLNLILDDAVVEYLKENREADCIISVQFRQHGHYAIAKLYSREEK